ncbi:uncharacterized protein METZ01_LOCUS311206 [marine metagenome]|uniref:Capsid protein n=1 Tax=marine metagenome TaxID=408172 RepID=A0A382NF77_9ZZZZ
MTTPFVQDTKLTAIAVGFKNAELIADRVAPRVEVMSEDFRWTEYNSEEMMTIPDTKVGRKGVPNEVEFTAKERSGHTMDYGLSDAVPQSDIDKAANHPSFDPLGRATLGVTKLVDLAREKRVADFVRDGNNYNHKQALTAGNKFSDYDADFFEIFGLALEQPLMRPNVCVLGHTEWFHISRNKSLLKAMGRNVDTQEGKITRQEFVDLLEINELIVGQSRYNMANKGQSANLSRLWGGTAAFHYRNSNILSLEEDMTFMATASYLGKVAYQKQLEPGELGLRGGVKVTVGDSVNEVQIAKEAGYLFTGVL